MASNQIFRVLALDIQNPDENVVDLKVEPDWYLSDLQKALEARFSHLNGKQLNRIKVWALTLFLDAPHTSDLSDMDIIRPLYNDISLTKIGLSETVVSHFKPFKPGDDSKIHLIVKLEDDAVNISAHAKKANLVALPTSDTLMIFWKNAWGKPLPINATKIPRRRAHVDDTTELDGISAGDLPDTEAKNETTMDDDAMEEDEYYRDHDETEQRWGDVLPKQPLIDASLTGQPDVEHLVRADYIRMYEAAEKAYNARDDRNNPPIVVISGQPGIGKTIWIHYAIRRRLGLELPTIWYAQGVFYRFTEYGVFRDRDPTDFIAASPPHWCFIDEADAPQGIPVSMSGTGLRGVFPIYVTSPNQSRWKSLDQAKSLTLVFMNPWSWEEAESACKLYPNVDPEKLETRFFELGPTARICFKYTDDDEAQFRARRKASMIRLEYEPVIKTMVNAVELPADFDTTIFLVRRHEDTTVPLQIDFMSKSIVEKVVLGNFRRQGTLLM